MKICRYKFHILISKDDIEQHLAESIVATEGFFGQAKARLNTAYLAANNKVVIDVSTLVGEHTAEIFTWRITKFYGEDSFSVERIRDENYSRA